MNRHALLKRILGSIDGRSLRRKGMIVLSSAVVFVVTYLLILPAFTLDAKSAASQGGIDVPGSEAVVDVPAADEELKEDSEPEPGKTETELLDSDETGLEVETDSLSVYGIVETTIEKTVLASDGLNYRITATYGPETGIPEDAELEVEEILPGDQDNAETSSVHDMSYEEYVACTENALGMEEGSAGYIRLFDIRIVDKNDHSLKCQPAEGTKVDVRIELTDAETESLRVVHFAEDMAFGTPVAAAVSEQTVCFEADGFSVYSVISSGETTDLNGKTFVIGNTTKHIFMMNTPQNNNTRLQAFSYTESGDTLRTNNNTVVTRWTFTSAPEGGNWYFIQDKDGNYLNIGNGNNSYVRVSSEPQAIYVRPNGNTVRLQRSEENKSTAINNYSGNAGQGFGPYNDEGVNEWFTLFDLDSKDEGMVGAYVYVAADQWRNNEEFKEHIGVGYIDNYNYFPAGVVYLPESYFDGKTDTGRLINSNEDWDILIEAIKNMDTSYLTGAAAANRDNKISEYADQVVRDLDYGASSQHSSLSANAGYQGFENLRYGYHLDLRFEANQITFYTGNNGLTADSFGRAKDGTLVDTRSYIPGAVVQEPRNLEIPSGYRFMGYYEDADFNIPWDGIGSLLHENEVVYIKITEEQNIVLNYRMVPGNEAGALTVYEEGLNPLTGTPTGSTATAKPGYRFAGWYADEACTEENLLSTDAAFVPRRTGDRWVDGTTYYAKFEEETVTLTFVAEDNVDHLELVGTPENVVSCEFTDDNKTMTVVVNTSSGSPVTVKGVAAEGYAIKEWTIDGRSNPLTAADTVTTKKADDPGAANNLWTDRTYHVWAEILKTITVTKEVKIIGTLMHSPEEADGTVYFALKDLSQDPAPWVLRGDGTIYTTSVEIVDGQPQGTAEFADLPAGTYEVWEVADEEAGNYGPGSTFAEGIVVSRIQTWISDTNTGNNVTVSEDHPDGEIRVINTLNHIGEAGSFRANKKWYTQRNTYADPNAASNVGIPADAWAEFTLYRVYENGVEESVETIRLDGSANDIGEETAWEAVFRDLANVDEDGHPVSYYVKETAMADMSTHDYYTTFNDTTSTNGGSISNVVAYGDVSVTKEIELPADISEADKNAFIDALQITVTGPSEVAENRRITQTLDRSSFTVTESTKNATYGTTTQSVKVLTLTASANNLPAGTYTIAESGYNDESLAYQWDSSHSWIKADKLPASQSSLINIAQYGKVDIDVPVGVNVTDNNFTTTVNLLNSYVVQDIKVTKVWDDLGRADANHPSVSVTLYRADSNNNKTSVSTQTIGANQTGSGLILTWENQPQNYTYSVEEAPVKGYSLESIMGNAADGFIVTNKKAAIIKIVKTDQGGVPLAGAQFSGDLITGTVTTEITGEEGATEAIVLNDSTVPLGTYTINEDLAPAGYNQLEGPVKISVEQGGTAGDIVVTATINGLQSAFVDVDRPDVDNTPDYWIITIRNDAGAALPHTGGPGTALFYIIGSVLAIGSAVCMIARRRVRREN